MTHAAAPDSLQGAVAAGILGAGPIILGAAQLCADLLTQARQRAASGLGPDAVAAELVREIRAAGDRAPGFGHPLHRPVDPRAERILALAQEHGLAGPHLDMARRLPAAVHAAWGKPLVMNVSMPIAAVLLDLEFPPAMVKAIPILARTAGLLAHLAEEQVKPIGFLMAHHAEAAIAYAPEDSDSAP